MRAEATIQIDAAPRTVLEFVADLRRYKRADHKIAAVQSQPSVDPASPRSRARYRGRLRGLPTPPEWQSVVLEPWTRLTLRSEPNQWTNRIATFEGGFICEQVNDEATQVTHYEQFNFNGALRAVAEAFLADWLQRDIEQEMQRLKDLIETEVRA